MKKNIQKYIKKKFKQLSAFQDILIMDLADTETGLEHIPICHMVLELGTTVSLVFYLLPPPLLRMTMSKMFFELT